MCICIEEAISEKVVGEDTRSELRKGADDGPHGPRQFRKNIRTSFKAVENEKNVDNNIDIICTEIASVNFDLGRAY
jgi:hypothetical protein